MSAQFRHGKSSKKVKGGKLLKIEALFKEGSIVDIKITGDFFLHPEETISKIEQSLKGEKVGAQIAANITKVLSENSASLIGITEKDVEEAIVEAFNTSEETSERV